MHIEYIIVQRFDLALIGNEINLFFGVISKKKKKHTTYFILIGRIQFRTLNTKEKDPVTRLGTITTIITIN